MKANAPLAGDDQNTFEIDWGYYTSVAKPALASHAQETSTDVHDDEDYLITQTPVEHFVGQQKEVLLSTF